MDDHQRLTGFRDAVAIAVPERKTPAAGGSVNAKGEINQSAVAFRVFEGLLAKGSVRDALYSLLRLTDYRFIAIFRFKDGKATSVAYVDRENLGVIQAAEVADTATYCTYVRTGQAPFVTADATHDARTAGHPAREVVRAYCGVPIISPEGEFIGTLCHYDLVPRDPTQIDLELLVQAVSLLEQSGAVPEYPA